jgi:hypothetical protein
MKRTFIAALLTAGLLSTPAHGQANMSKYIGDMKEALVDVGQIEPYSDCHHIEIRLDGGWGAGVLPSGQERAADGSLKLTYAVFRNDLASVSFDLADIDEEKTELFDFFSGDQVEEVGRLARAGNLTETTGHFGRYKVVEFSTHSLNGLTKVNINIKAEPPTGTGYTWDELMAQLGATTHHGGVALIWFKDVPHQEAFKAALEHAAVVCRIQPNP